MSFSTELSSSSILERSCMGRQTTPYMTTTAQADLSLSQSCRLISNQRSHTSIRRARLQHFSFHIRKSSKGNRYSSLSNDDGNGLQSPSLPCLRHTAACCQIPVSTMSTHILPSYFSRSHASRLAAGRGFACLPTS
eukprot:scaffold25307_cov168-Amphora_coffeaeformis.AAC.2